MKVQSVSAFVLCGVSIFSSTAISVDRLLALSLGLRYRHVVTLRRIRAFITCFWLTGVSLGFLYIFWNCGITLSLATVLIILSVFISLFSCAKIFLKLRQHQAQVQGHAQQRQPNEGGIPLNIARYKKTVYSIVWVQLALIVCYIPFVISVIILIMEDKGS